jgi:hypothetical protein
MHAFGEGPPVPKSAETADRRSPAILETFGRRGWLGQRPATADGTEPRKVVPALELGTPGISSRTDACQPCGIGVDCRISSRAVPPSAERNHPGCWGARHHADQETRLYASGNIGGHCDHRRIGCLVVARCPIGSRNGSTSPVHESVAATGNGAASLPRRAGVFPARHLLVESHVLEWFFAALFGAASVVRFDRFQPAVGHRSQRGGVCHLSAHLPLPVLDGTAAYHRSGDRQPGPQRLRGMHQRHRDARIGSTTFGG